MFLVIGCESNRMTDLPIERILCVVSTQDIANRIVNILEGCGWDTEDRDSRLISLLGEKQFRSLDRSVLDYSSNFSCTSFISEMSSNSLEGLKLSKWEMDGDYAYRYVKEGHRVNRERKIGNVSWHGNVQLNGEWIRVWDNFDSKPLKSKADEKKGTFGFNKKGRAVVDAFLKEHGAILEN